MLLILIILIWKPLIFSEIDFWFHHFWLFSHSEFLASFVIPCSYHIIIIVLLDCEIKKVFASPDHVAISLYWEYNYYFCDSSPKIFNQFILLLCNLPDTLKLCQILFDMNDHVLKIVWQTEDEILFEKHNFIHVVSLWLMAQNTIDSFHSVFSVSQQDQTSVVLSKVLISQLRLTKSNFCRSDSVYKLVLLFNLWTRLILQIEF